MSAYFKQLVVLTCCIFYLYTAAYAEGTKEMRPTAAEFGHLSIDPGYTPFATVGCQPNYRLNIHISNVGETILFGLHGTATNNKNYNLRKPNGTVVLSGVCPNAVGQTGYIPDWNTAVIGPYPGSGGYTPLSYTVTSSADLGDFYIDFSGSEDFTEFDFQVVTGLNTPALPGDAINGRVWSGAWQFYAALQSPYQPFGGKLYVYSDDGIVTSCKFNDAHVGRFTVFCNQYGCVNTGNFSFDRKSRSNNTSGSFPGIAQYKIFLNNPDILAYPDGVYGTIIGSPSMIPDPAYPLCSGNMLIVTDVNKTGNVEILIDIPYGDITYDVTLHADVTPGTNYIPWNGKDGQGGQIPNGTNIYFTATYTNGLTNMPIWDQERNPIGYIVTLERPVNLSILNPTTYWDDTNISGGSCPTGSNFNGCSPTATGCHIWSGTDCHDKMINTWWFITTSSTSNSIIYNAGAGPSQPNISGPNVTCTFPTSINYTTEPGMNNFSWIITPAGSGMITAGAGTNSITLTWINAGTHTLKVNYSDSNGCFAALPGNLTVTVNSVNPVIFGDNSICFNSSGNIYTTQSGMTKYTWIVSSCGTITAGGTKNDNFIEITWITPGAKTVSVNFTDPNGCTAISPTVFPVTVHPIPTPTISTPSLMAESFENGGNIPTGWILETLAPGNSLSFVTSSIFPSSYAAYNGSYFVRFDSYDNDNGTIRLKRTNPVSTLGLTQVTLDFAWLESSAVAVANDWVEVEWSTDGSTWNPFAVFPRYNITQGWKVKNVVLPIAALNQPSLYVAFKFTSDYGMDCYLDFVHLTTGATVCPGSSVTYTTQTGMTNYNWSVSSGGIITSGAVTAAIVVNWTTSENQQISVNYTNSNNCSASVPTVQSITVNTGPAPTITGNVLVNAGSSGVSYSTEAGMIGYNWAISSGGIITNGLGTDVITVAWNIEGPQYVSVNYTNASGCMAITPTIFNVTVNPGIPATRDLFNLIVGNGQNNCYNASQIITVAGNGNLFYILAGGSGTFIAGQKIFYLPGTTIQHGSYMLGYIAPAGPWCQSPSMPAVAMEVDETPRSIVQSSFKVYPNPTTGNFILELTGESPTDKVWVEIYGIWGEKVLTEVLSGERKHEFSLSDKPVGVYFIRVISGDNAETIKIIKQ